MKMKEMTTREVQLVSLDILKDVHKFCVKNNIKYSLSGGTLLGAIRHNGFIPWDDDLDIQLAYPDYEYLINNFQSEKGYRLFSREARNGQNVELRIARICDMEKTYVDQGAHPWTNEKIGIWIDVIPVHGAPDNIKEMRRHYRRTLKYARLSNVVREKNTSWNEVRKYKSTKKKLKFLAKKIVGLFVCDDATNKYIAELKKYDYTTSNYFYAGPQNGMGEWQPKKNMESYELHQFEDDEFYVMSGYDDNLKGLYGNYMQLPPVEQRVTHNFYKYYWK